jgi:hypothetical protein
MPTNGTVITGNGGQDSCEAYLYDITDPTGGQNGTLHDIDEGVVLHKGQIVKVNFDSRTNRSSFAEMAANGRGDVNGNGTAITVTASGDTGYSANEVVELEDGYASYHGTSQDFAPVENEKAILALLYKE